MVERDEGEPMLVRCRMRVPQRQAKKLIPTLGLAFGCGGAVAIKKKDAVEIEAVIEIRKVGEIVGKGLEVTVVERIPIKPFPANEITRDVDAWFAQIRRRSR